MKRAEQVRHMKAAHMKLRQPMCAILDRLRRVCDEFHTETGQRPYRIVVSKRFVQQLQMHAESYAFIHDLQPPHPDSPKVFGSTPVVTDAPKLPAAYRNCIFIRDLRRH